VHGRVQGVGFRMAARREAERLGLAGSVHNRADGTVEVQAEGEADGLRRFGAWLADGPRAARVERVDDEEMEPRGDTGFRIF
jgi:acylphosphatase